MTENNPSIVSVSAGIKDYRQQCAEVKANAERDFPRCHIVGRGVELIALDETGERNDALGGPEYIAAKDLTIKYLRQTSASWAKYSPGPNNPHTLAGIHIAGGFDIYDSFGEYMQAMKGDWMDYDIYGDWAGQDIPLNLLS